MDEDDNLANVDADADTPMDAQDDAGNVSAGANNSIGTGNTGNAASASTIAGTRVAANIDDDDDDDDDDSDEDLSAVLVYLPRGVSISTNNPNNPNNPVATSAASATPARSNVTSMAGTTPFSHSSRRGRTTIGGGSFTSSSRSIDPSTSLRAAAVAAAVAVSTGTRREFTMPSTSKTLPPPPPPTAGAASSSSHGSAVATTSSAAASMSHHFRDWDSTVGDNHSSDGDGAPSTSDGGAKPSFFFGTSSFSLHSRKEVAALVNTECCRGGPTPDLDSIIDTLLNPGTPIDNPDNIEWIRWLIAGGRTPLEFVKIVRSYDNHAKCGLVWVPHVVAYRCRTCGISPCMSICRDCFKKGDHTNHDFNMFLSQAGGACDCGDTSVMKAEGFCSDHGINNRVNRDPVPNNLLAVAEAIMPKLLFRLLQHFREHSDTTLPSHMLAAYSCEEFANMLIDLNNMGEIMRKVMTRALINPEVYKYFMEPPCLGRHGRFLRANREKYEDAVNRFPSPEPPDDYKHLPALGEKLVHTTLLEEFIFWTFKFEFPQTLVCFLLNMLPDQDYKEHLTRTFVMHYSRIPSVLEMSRDPDTLSNRVVHMSVQLFSNESLALKMVNELSLLHVMIISLKLMMSKILIQNTLHDPAKNFHFVIDCTRQVMKDHCYWPLVSDFNNVLSHESVALVFLRDDNLIDMWFQFLSMLQGMNVNTRETASHVEFEPNSYYAAFSCELEASAYPMWSIITHLQDGTHAHLAKKIINYCVNTLHEWLDSIYFMEPKLSLEEMMHASFHFPLHRYLAAFVCQAVTKMGMTLSDVLPTRPYILPLLMIHPLRVQSFFYEILAGKWVRNGLQIKGQAMTYIQANFCNSMADMDLFFLQICATNLPQYFFLQNTIELFDVGVWLETAPLKQPLKNEQSSMLEGFLTFLATLVTSRTNLGNDEATQCIIEISALLATENKTHSQLLELMPERSGNVHTKNFETFLKKLSVYKAPSFGSENLEQGLFTPIDEVWEKYYDPLHVLLRAVHRRDFQSSLDRFTNYVKSKNKMPTSGNLWPPFRLPLPVGASFTDPCRILNSRIFHSTILSILYRAVHSRDVSEHLLALAIFLLEIAVETSNDINENGNDKPAAMVECEPKHKSAGYTYGSRREPPKLFQCYPTDNLSCNLRHVVLKLSLKSRDPQVTTSNYRSNPFYADLDYDEESESEIRMIGDGYSEDDFDEPGAMSIARNYSMSQALMPMHLSSMEVALPPDLSVVAETGVVLRQNSNDDDPLLRDTETAMELAAPALDFRFPLQQITLPESGMEVAIRRDLLLAETNSAAMGAIGGRDGNARANAQANEMFSPTTPTGSGMLLPFQRVQPVAVPSSSNMDIVPSNALGSSLASTSRRHNYDSGTRKRTVDIAIGGNNKDEIIIEESILSLLLKLHSQLSGTLDSFSLSDGEEKEESDESSAGDPFAATSKSFSSSHITAMEIDCNEASTSAAAAAAAAAVAAATAAAAAASSKSQNAENCFTSQKGQSAKLANGPKQRQISVSTSRIGDGPFFIGNLLRKMARRDEQCAKNIDEIRQRLWPNQREKQAEQQAREAKEKEERRKRARERQQRLIQDFANKQKQFMASAAANCGMECGMDDDEDEDLYEEQPREKEYDCIICNCTTPSTETNPIGLVVLVESSGIVGHRRRIPERLPLPLCPEDEERLKQSTRLATEFERRSELLSLKFGDESWYLSNNMAYDNGVHVQSCGHHVHLKCLEAYLKTLYSTQRQPLQDRGEFYCPVCRQMSNSVLPLSPALDRPTPVVRSGNQPFEQLVAQLTDLIKDNEKPPPSKLSEAMGHAMEAMTNITQRKAKRASATFRKLFIFVTSIARTNLEAEIIQRGGSLCSTNATRYKPKRDCIVPLLHVLSVHVRVLVEWPLWRSWASLAGLPVNDAVPLPDYCLELIPSLLADPIALLLKFILLAPLHLGQEYFTCMVKVMYNLLYYQIVLQLCVTLTDLECDFILSKYGDASLASESNSNSTAESVRRGNAAAATSTSASASASCSTSSTTGTGTGTGTGSGTNLSYLGRAMALVLKNTNRLSHLRRDSIPSTSFAAVAAAAAAAAAAAGGSPATTDSSMFSNGNASVEVNLKSMELKLQGLCLPFLRIAALLRQHLYHHDMPEITSPPLEFVRLTYYLELVTESMDWDCFNASKGLCFIPGTEETLPQFWCSQLMDVRPPTDTVRELVMINQHALWQQPKLLELPREYERLFTYYHERPCLNCYKVPKESSICLLCGTIVCLKQNCCAENSCCEAVRHTLSCGGGIGIFLVVTSTYIVVIRGRRACLWGSLYLDDFDEEDRDLKRGKPLYLSKDRFNLLESQWLSHKFAHTKHTWVFHRDLL